MTREQLDILDLVKIRDVNSQIEAAIEVSKARVLTLNDRASMMERSSTLKDVCLSFGRKHMTLKKGVS